MYDSNFYGELRRKEFAGANINSQTTLVGRWYPKGPIHVVKCGIMHSVAQSGSELTISFLRNASTLATFLCSTVTAQWARSSVPSLSYDVDKGSYLTVTSDGTADAGSVQCFIDYYQLYDKNHEAPGVA
jgi:hypothetical protein